MSVKRFVMNGIIWNILPCTFDSPVLIDRTGKRTLACTDPFTKQIFILKDLSKEMEFKVLSHELVHCLMISYGLLDDVKVLCKPGKQIETEEFICGLVAEHLPELVNILKLCTNNN